jgi:ABC-type nickel/cobalt efflux system permease component RcnA
MLPPGPSPLHFVGSTNLNFQENNVKRFITWMGLSLVLLLGVLSFAQDSAKQDMKDAGHETKQAAKDAGHATKKTAQKAGHKVKKGTHKAAQKTEEGARKVEDKTSPQ